MGLSCHSKILFSLLGLSLILTACGGGGGEDGGTTPDTAPPPVPKETKFHLLSRTRVAADGFSTSIVKIRVTDENENPVPRYTLRLTSPVEAGVNYISCIDSDAKGVVLCRVRAHLDGLKTLSIAGSNSTIEVEFAKNYDPRGVKFDIVSASHGPMAAGPDLVTGTAGKKYNVPRQEYGTNVIINDVSIAE
jgi:hypothetical protein